MFHNLLPDSKNDLHSPLKEVTKCLLQINHLVLEIFQGVCKSLGPLKDDFLIFLDLTSFLLNRIRSILIPLIRLFEGILQLSHSNNQSRRRFVYFSSCCRELAILTSSYSTTSSLWREKHLLSKYPFPW